MPWLTAAWRVSLRRTRADWPIVVAVWLITLVAAALVAAGPIYWSAASTAGLQRTLASTPVAATSIQVDLYGSRAHIAEIDSRVVTDLQGATATISGSVVRDVRGAATLALAGRPSLREGDLGILGSLDALPGHATLVMGAWPADTADPSGAIPVVVLDAVARELSLAVGDQLQLITQVGDRAVIAVRLVGVFAVDAIADPYWHGEAQLTSGVVAGAGFRTFGPFLTTRADLLQRTPIVSVHALWRVSPDLGRLTVDESASLLASLQALPGRLLADIGEAPVSTGLPAILSDSVRSLLVSRTNLLLLMGQLAILATYAVILVASLLVDHRRIDTALLLSRGAGPSRVAMLALAEALLLAIPAVILGPWLAVAALTLLNVAGPLADVGLDIAPRVTGDAYVAAGAVGAVGVVLLALPAMLAARSLAAEHRGLSRQETRTFGQRMGLDLALLAIAAIALWQLRLYGAPLTRTVQGSLGIDPLLVAAPAITLLAGAILALRLLPLLAQGVEATVARRRDLVASLGSRQLARRPLRYTRSALLLMIAVSMGVFAVSYAATWTTSQRDQAAYQAGADIRVQPGQNVGGLLAWALPTAYSGLAGVERVSPVERIADGVSLPTGSAALLGIDAEAAASIALLRGDQSSSPLATLMARLREGRPDPPVAMLPAGTAFLGIVPRLDIVSIGQLVVDAANQEATTKPLDPAALASIRVSVNAVVRDGVGLLYRVESSPGPVTTPSSAILLPLEGEGRPDAGTLAPAGARLAGPVQLVSLGLTLWLPADAVMSDATIGVASVSAAGEAAGPWADVALDASAWRAQSAQGYDAMTPVPADQASGTAVHFSGKGMQRIVFGNGPGRPATRIALQPAALVAPDAVVPAIVNRALTSSAAASLGDTVAATVDGAARSLRIVGVVDAFPTTDPSVPLVVLDEPTLGLLRLGDTGLIRSPAEWWIKAAGGRSEALATTLRASPFDSVLVSSVDERARSLSTDPVAIGTIGALVIGFIATGLFAIVGLTVSAAVSARERRTEFALLRALGLSAQQLSGWLWLENGGLVLVSLLAGTALGLLTSWLVLPFVTVTQGAAAPVPPVIVEVPWDRILLLNLASAVALGAAVIALGSALGRLGLGSVLRMGED